MRNRYPVGMRVRIHEGAGLDSGKTGIVVTPVLDHRGIPKVPGAYKPFDPSIERYIRLDDGTVTTMFTNYLSHRETDHA
jgi:hypothetical protein